MSKEEKNACFEALKKVCDLVEENKKLKREIKIYQDLFYKSIEEITKEMK